MKNKEITPGQLLPLSFTVREVTAEMLENRQAEFVISSDSVDTYGTVFRPDGCDLSRFEKNPVVFYAHRSWGDDPDNLIGSGQVYRENNTWVGRVTFEPEDVNPKAEKIYKKVQNGTLRMASIGANPLTGHWGAEKAGEDPKVLYFDTWELIEFSIVPLGSNPDALKRHQDSAEFYKEKFKRTVKPVVKETKKTLAFRAAQLQINKNL
jgi:HK97 family phage prohead protease